MEYYPKYNGSESVSIVNALAEMGINSSYTNRERIAAANGIVGYSGESAQNLRMLSLLKDGKLVKPTESEPIPAVIAEPDKNAPLVKAAVCVAGVCIGLYALNKMLGNQPKTATKKSAKKSARKKSSRKGLNGSTNRPPRVKTMTVAEGKRWGISEYPNFSATGSIIGMRKRYGRYALLVRCGSYIYNVQGNPEIYDAAH